LIIAFALFKETFNLAESKTPSKTLIAKLKESSDFTGSMKTFVYKTINAGGDID
jgi:hypothetical protein